jgi:acetyl-CoA synthetase
LSRAALSSLPSPSHNAEREGVFGEAASACCPARLEDSMSDKIYEVPAEWTKRAFINEAEYKKMYDSSLADPNGFWAEQAKRIHWMKHFSKVKNTSFAKQNVSIKWFEDGATNVAYNCIDRHLHSRGHQTAIIWEGDDPKDSKHITYKQLHDEV